MIYWKTLVQIPSKKVLEDLASREGEPTPDSMCQLPGMLDTVKKYANNEPLESVYLKLIKLKDIRTDSCSKEAIARFEAINGRPMKTIYDIGETVIRDYIGNLVYSATRYNSGSTKEDRQNFQYGRFIQDSEDDGHIIMESDLQVKKDGPSAKDKIYWNKKLPYILKKLHQISKTIEISIISSLVCYYKARRDYNRNKKYSEAVSVGKIIEKGVMKMGKDGKIKRVDPDDPNSSIIYEKDGKGNFREYVYDHLVGNTKDELYDLIHELMFIINELNIDFCNEKAERYEEDFINDLVTSYVTSNRAYLNMKCNPASLKAIRSISYDKQPVITERKLSRKEMILKMINRQVSIFDNAEDKHLDEYRDTSGELLTSFINKMMCFEFDTYGRYLDNIYFNNGFVCMPDGNPVLFPSSFFRKYNNDEAFMLHREGFMILVSSLRDNLNNTVLVWFPIRLAIGWMAKIERACNMKGIETMYLKDNFNGVYKQISSEHIAKKSFGTWFETSV